MKPRNFLISVFIVLGFQLYLFQASAQNISQGHLPEGAIARLGKGRIYATQFSQDNTQLIVASGSGIWHYDVQTGEEIDLIRCRLQLFTTAAFSLDGRTLASGGGYTDGKVHLWDVGTGRSLKVLEGHMVNSVSFSPDGRTLASTSNDRTVRLWDVRAGEHKQTYGVPCTVLSNPAFSPDGRSLAIGAAFNRVLLLDLTIGETWEVVSEDAESAKVVAFSPDGTTLVSVAETGVMFLWDVTRFTSQQQRPDLQQQQLQREHVRLVYFRPSDRAAQDAIDTRLHTLIKDTQHFYAAQMHRHDRKTFTFETDTHGKAVVHRVDGKFTDTYYQTDTYDRVRKEIGEQFNLSEHIYLVAIDVSSELVNDGGQGHICGIGGGSWHSSNNETWQRNAGGLAVIPASGRCFTVGVTAHELGHTFSLEHDFRDDANLMAYGSQSRLSEYAADWLSVHPYFNTTSKGVGQATMLAMRSNRLPRLQFHLTDSDGLHQAQLLIPTTAADPVGGLKLHDCQLLEGKTSSTVAFNVSGGVAGNSEVTLQVIDVRGNISKQTFSVKTDSVVAVSDVRTGTDVATVSLSPASVSPAGVGEHFVLNLMISGGVDVVGYQATVDFDTASLRYVSSANAEYLAGAFVIPTVVKNNRVTLAATALQGSSEGDGTLATLTFKVLTAHPGMPSVSDAKLTDSNADFLAVRIENSSVSEPVSLAGDVNGDGVLSVEDLSWAATRLGQRGENTADMNGDGVVDAADLLLIATAIDQGNAAPSLHSDSVAEMFTAAEVRRWLWLARQQGLTDPMYQRGFLLLEQLLAILTPKETALLSNYPNPFNPETWIPYHLSEPAEVRIAIYAADGRLVRTLGLEHQAAGIYESRSRAAYWDGRNALGEPVASGVYFYTLTAGDFAATRKMLIRK